jgi:putative GTP pyrophosphokinase
MVLSGDLTGVEITPKALKLFLDQKLGADERISDWNYDWTTRTVKSLGFRDLKQLDSAITPYKDEALSLIVYGTRQGQVSRFDLMLLAALGEVYIERHPWRKELHWFEPRQRALLAKFSENGIRISTYDPLADPPETASAAQNTPPVSTTGPDTSNSS